MPGIVLCVFVHYSHTIMRPSISILTLAPRCFLWVNLSALFCRVGLFLKSCISAVTNSPQRHRGTENAQKLRSSGSNSDSSKVISVPLCGTKIPIESCPARLIILCESFVSFVLFVVGFRLIGSNKIKLIHHKAHKEHKGLTKTIFIIMSDVQVM